MRFALALAVTSAIGLTDAAPVVQAEAAVSDVPHRDPADYYKVVAAPPTETTSIPPHKQFKGIPQATEGITVQQAKRWNLFGDPTLNRTEPVLPQLPKTNVNTNRFQARRPLIPCPRFCERFVETNTVIRGIVLCPCLVVKTASPTITEGHGPTETGKPSSTITEGHGPKVTEKASSTITRGRGPKVTEMPSSTITLEHEPKVTEKASSTISKGRRPKKTRKPWFTEMMPWGVSRGHGPKVTEMPSSTITLEHGPKVTKMPSSTKAHGHEETKMSQL